MKREREKKNKRDKKEGGRVVVKTEKRKKGSTDPN
jgi:hypothetical protein